MTKPERKPSQTIFTAEHPPEMKPAPHYRFALVPGERCVSHEVTGQVRGRGALDQVLGTRDSHAGSRATEQQIPQSLPASGSGARAQWPLLLRSTGETSQS